MGKAGEPTQMTPVGAGAIASIGKRQQLAGAGRQRRFQRRGAESNPGLQMTGAGLQHHTGVMPLGAHGGDHCWLCPIQVDENVTGVLAPSVRLNVDVASFAVASAQKSDRGSAAQLVCCPKSFTRKGPPRLVVNQADQVQLVRHRCELPANGLQSEKESAVVHDRHFAVETDRRTMNLQRTANCVLTVCLSPGGKSKKRCWCSRTQADSVVRERTTCRSSPRGVR